MKDNFFNAIFALVAFLLMLFLVFGGIPGVSAGENIAAFNASVSGERNLGQDLTWSVLNVSGTADVEYHYTVYDFREIGNYYTYYSKNWGRWFESYADPGNKFIAVWVRGETNGTTFFGFGSDRFYAWVWGNTTIQVMGTPLQDLPIKYGSEYYRPVVIAELQNRTRLDGSLLTTEWYSWKDGYELTRFEPGASNAWDGVVLFQVPNAATIDDISIYGWFGYYGYGVWHLTDHVIVQDSQEQERLREQQRIDIEKRSGLRLSDRLETSRAAG
jgi:hypothetical protein